VRWASLVALVKETINAYIKCMLVRQQRKIIYHVEIYPQIG
jgi:hypothetical protein